MADAHSDLLYRTIETDLRQKILAGDYKPGDKLPTEAELCEAYQVSRITVRRAIQNLVNDNMLTRYRGKGTFVRLPVHEFDETLENNMGFGSILPAGTGAKRKIVGTARMGASELVAERLGIAQGSPVQLVRRVSSVEGTPIVFDTTYVSSAAFPTFIDDLTPTIGLYELLEDHYHLKLSRADVRLSAVAASRDEARLLECVPGAPLFQCDKVVYDIHERPVHFSLTKLVGERSVSRFSFTRKH